MRLNRLMHMIIVQFNVGGAEWSVNKDYPCETGSNLVSTLDMILEDDSSVTVHCDDRQDAWHLVKEYPGLAIDERVTIKLMETPEPEIAA